MRACTPFCARVQIFKNDVSLFSFHFADSRCAVMSKTRHARMIFHVVYLTSILIYIPDVHVHAILGNENKCGFQHFTSQDAGMGWVGIINISWWQNYPPYGLSSPPSSFKGGVFYEMYSLDQCRSTCDEMFKCSHLSKMTPTSICNEMNRNSPLSAP